jgi:mannose-6-phosphate isomerase
MTKISEPSLYPLTFEPVLKDYIWGGRNLESRLGRELPPDVDIAESWEVAAHENGDVTVNNGPLAGKSLSELCREMGADLIGTAGAWAQERGKFPLLIKLLDANRKLSVQVHPDDGYAQEHEGGELGKTEMWVVLHAEEDASIILGVKEGTTPDNFRVAVREGALEPLLHEIEVRSGDFICVPSGSLHAILGGLLIAEIQQNSDVTYRVYDWNRVGHDGTPRPLHVDKAQDVINFDQVVPSLPEARLLAEADGLRRWELCRNDYFLVERVEMAEGAVFDGQCSGRSLEIWGTIRGDAMVTGGDRQVSLSAVQFSLLPASMGEFEIGTSGPAMLLRTTLQ